MQIPNTSLDCCAEWSSGARWGRCNLNRAIFIFIFIFCALFRWRASNQPSRKKSRSRGGGEPILLRPADRGGTTLNCGFGVPPKPPWFATQHVILFEDLAVILVIDAWEWGKSVLSARIKQDPPCLGYWLLGSTFKLITISSPVCDEQGDRLPHVDLDI